jgi:SAM-dependent methyltransferase
MAVTQPADDWWRTLYDDIVADLFLVRKDRAELDDTVAFLRRELGLPPGCTVFDQCCGTGDIALSLARTGLNVIGVDQCERYIERARSAGEARCEFHVADARAFAVPGRCDGGFNWNTGFGNGDDEGNLALLRRARESLRPNAGFALDYQHVPRILRDFQRCLVHRRKHEQGDLVLIRESRVDLAAGSLLQTWTFFLPDGRRVERRSAVRLYLPHVLGEMMREAGFTDIRFHGGLVDEPLDLDSPRCIVIGLIAGE